MSDPLETSHLKLPYLAAAQAQKHVTHNEALRSLDAIVQLAVLDTTLASPPGSPADGDRYIPAATATGAWTGHDNDIAHYVDGVWVFYAPEEGWDCFDANSGNRIIFSGGSWSGAGGTGTVTNGAALADSQVVLGDGGGAGVKTTGITIDTDGSLTANSDSKIATQKATKTYIDGLAVNIGKRARARAATTANITIATALNNGDTLDGVTLSTGDLVLVKNQTAAAEDGIYVVGASPARAGEFDTYNEHPGSLIAVAEGSTNADTLWLCTSNDGGTLNTTAIAFSRMVIAGELLAANNLSDLGSAATARTNLGLGGAAVLAVGSTAGTVAAGDDSRITGAAQKASNLSDLGSAATARTNLGAAASGANTDIASLTILASLNAGPLGGWRNLLINPDGRINQRVAGSGIADDTYGHDRWYALTQTGAIAVSTLSDAENGTPSMWRLTQSQATAQRMGYAQIIRGANCKWLRGKAVTLGGRFRCSSAQAIRYAILEWTGSEDLVTSDVVNSWTNGTFTAGNFFSSSNLTVTAVGSITPSAATLTDLTALTATLGSSVNNLIILIWTEGTAAQSVTLDGALQFEVGSVASQREVRPSSVELQRCLPYYQKSYGLATAPATATNVGSNFQQVPSTTGPLYWAVRFAMPMCVSPTVTAYDGAGASGKVYKGANGKTAAILFGTECGFSCGTTDATNAGDMLFHWTAEAEL